MGQDRITDDERTAGRIAGSIT